jgi:hypothetical protein
MRDFLCQNKKINKKKLPANIVGTFLKIIRVKKIVGPVYGFPRKNH